MQWIRLLSVVVSIRLLHFAVLLCSDLLFRDYDTSAQLSASVDLLNHDSQPCIRHTASTQLSRLLVWDSVFFTEIAKRGYAYEQFYAFFPLLPGGCLCSLSSCAMDSTKAAATLAPPCSDVKHIGTVRCPRHGTLHQLAQLSRYGHAACEV